MQKYLSNTLLAGQVGINFSPFGRTSQSFFTSELNVRENMEEGKIATAWAQFATQRSPSMYTRMCAGATLYMLGRFDHSVW
jgi:hypothetical protein